MSSHYNNNDITNLKKKKDPNLNRGKRRKMKKEIQTVNNQTQNREMDGEGGVG